MTHQHSPEKIGESIHRWNASSGAVETWILESGGDVLAWAQGGPDWWYVTVTWHRIGGVPTPSGFQVHATSGKPNDALKPVSRDLTKRLPLGEITTQGLEQLIAFHRGVTLALGADTPERRTELAALRAGTPDRMESVYRLAFALHAEARTGGHRQPSKWTYEQLGLRGVTDARGQSPSYEVVRTKWIPKGKVLAAKDSRRTMRSGQQHREERQSD